MNIEQHGKYSRKEAGLVFKQTVPFSTINEPPSAPLQNVASPFTQEYRPVTSVKPNIPDDFDPYKTNFKPVDKPIANPPKPKPTPVQPTSQYQPLSPENNSPSQLENQLPVSQQLQNLQTDLKKHKRWATFFFAISLLMWLLLLLLIGSYIGTTVTTANKSLPNLGCLTCNGNNAIIDGSLTVNDIQLLNTTSGNFFDVFAFLNNITASLTCAHCAPNGTFIVDNDMIVDGDTFLYGNTTAYQISLLNTTSGALFDLFTFLNNLNVSSLPCAYCTPNGTFVITGNTVITNNGTLQVDYINLLNTTSDQYFDVFTAIDKLLNLPVENCTVIQVCGPSGNITAALAQATLLNPNATNSVGIEFCPGTYIIDNSAGPLVVPAYVSITSKVVGGASLTPSTAGFAIFDLQGYNTIFGFEFFNGLNAPYIIQTGFINFGITSISHCRMRSGLGLYASSSSGLTFQQVDISDCDLVADNGLPTKTLQFDHTGETYLNNVNMQHVPGSFGIGVYITSVTCVIFATDISLIGLSTGIYIPATTLSITIDQLYASDISYAVVHMPTIVSGFTELFISDVILDPLYGPIASDYIIDNTETVTYQFGDLQHYNCTSGPKPSTVDAVYVDISLNEGAIQRNLIDVSVGVPEKPQSVFCGTGKHSSREYVIYYRDPFGAFTKIDDLLCSGNTYTMPVDLGGMMYFAVDLDNPSTGLPFQHFGQIMNVITPAVLGGSTVVFEYYDGLNWHDIIHMTYYYTYPYTPFEAGWGFETTGTTITNYNWQMKTGYFYYGIPFDPWGLGNDPGYTRPLYWVRYRVAVAPMASPPTFSYIGYTGNTKEDTVEGFTLYHGFARRISDIIFSSSLFQPQLTGSTLGDYSVSFFTPSVMAGFSNAVMAFGTNALRGMNFNIPIDADVSCAFNVTLTYIPTVAANGVASLYFGQLTTKVGDDLSTKNPIFFNALIPIPAITANTQQLYSTTIYLPDSQIYSQFLGESIGWFFLSRFSGSDPTDTYLGDIQVLGLTLYYIQRMEGGPTIL